MSIKTDYLFKALHIISWIIFVGLCFEAGAFLVTSVLNLSLDPIDADKLWKEFDLTALRNFNETYFVYIAAFMIIVTVLKCIMFYVIVKVFNDKKYNRSEPFNDAVRQFVLTIAYLALGIGLFSFMGGEYVESFTSMGVEMPDVQQLKLGGADVWLFMGIALLVIASVFKKGIELQNESDLTV